MDASLLAVLNENERLTVAETETDNLSALDEEAAIELETRIRRARNKYVSQYRRAASARVAERGGRGRARPENTRAKMKAEAFEAALARVSRRVAVLARRAAADLRAERLAAARAAKQAQRSESRRPAPADEPRPVDTEVPAGERVLDSPTSRKRRASSRAQAARWQAKRDSSE